MRKNTLRFCLGVFLLGTVLTGCDQIKRPEETTVGVETAAASFDEEQELLQETEVVIEIEEAEPTKEEEMNDLRTPVEAKGIYISSYTAGNPEVMERIIGELDRTEANALVIDFKDDSGRVACAVDSDLIHEVGSVKEVIPNAEELLKTLKEHGIYTIARIPAFRDAWLGKSRPDWCVKKSDGTLFYDRDGNTWVNPYCEEAWDYLVEIGLQAGKLGFDEVQFDYVRFCTEKGMKDAVFDEMQVQERTKTDVVCDFIEYAYSRLKEEGLFVSADVFGAIIGSEIDAQAVGQVYGDMAKHLDYICPMIYPSHYGDGNFGLDHPDIHPYETILAALTASRQELETAASDGSSLAKVRPWLQDFTASWLKHYISYGSEEIRAQIQAVYDAGYKEWILWDASCKYSWDGLLTTEEEEAEDSESEA